MMQLDVCYEEAEARKFPEQVAIIIANEGEGKYNPITVGWIMPVSMNPPMWAFCLAKSRHSLQAIRYSQAFVISFPSCSMGADATFFGTHSGRDMDKLKRFGTKTEKAAKIDGVLLSDAVVNFECVLHAEYPVGDCYMFIGEVVGSHVNTDPSVRRLYVLTPDLALGGVMPE